MFETDSDSPEAIRSMLADAVREAGANADEPKVQSMLDREAAEISDWLRARPECLEFTKAGMRVVKNQGGDAG